VLHKPFTLHAMAATLAAHLSPTPVKRGGADPREIPMPAIERIPLPEARQEPPAPQTSPEAIPEIEGDPILEPAVTRQLLDMARMGGGAAVARIYGLYLENGPPALAEIAAAVAEMDLPRTGRAAHALKSMSLSLGAQRVATLAGDLERSARGEAHRLFEDLRDRIGAEMELTYARIRRLMAEEGLTQPPDDQARPDQAVA